MKNNTLIFLRHAETKKDPKKNAAFWGLSEQGRREAERIALEPIMKTVEAIYTSGESKTFLTAEPIAKMQRLSISPLNYFNEVERGDKFLSKEDFEKEKILQLSNLSYAAFDGETGLKALERFKLGITKVLNQNSNKTILIVTHGTILNIYFADISKRSNELFERWSKTPFCAYGIVRNGKVIKDLVM